MGASHSFDGRSDSGGGCRGRGLQDSAAHRKRFLFELIENHLEINVENSTLNKQTHSVRRSDVRRSDRMHRFADSGQVSRVGPKPGPGRGLVLGALRGLARAGGSQSAQLHPRSRSDRVPFTEGPTFSH